MLFRCLGTCVLIEKNDQGDGLNYSRFESSLKGSQATGEKDEGGESISLNRSNLTGAVVAAKRYRESSQGEVQVNQLL